MPPSPIGYYAVRIGINPGVYMSWEECKEQVHKYPGALYKKFYTRKQADEYVTNIIDNDCINVWTDGSCLNLGKQDAKAAYGIYWGKKDPRNISARLPGKLQTNNRAEIYAVIKVLEYYNEEKMLVVNTDSGYVINSYNSKYPKKNSDLVHRMNELIKEKKCKVKFIYVKGHSGNEGNNEADRLASLGLEKPDIVEKLNIPESVNKQKKTIKDYFK
jgi:ribonuclease HI